ncbi:MAG: CPBP family intramembrane metalloprotease [Pseudobutyrivibrio sp.]|nr:CPBP family intramembrane metalloprotease [Pseudobutyrivibrio sp.]
MKKFKSNRIFQILYPLLVYYILYNVLIGSFYSLFGDRYGYVFAILMAGILTLIPIYYIYRKLPKLIPGDISDKKVYLKYLAYILLTVALALVINLIIVHLPIYQSSQAFQGANQRLNDGGVLIKILCNAIVIPLLEETLYRGIVAGQLTLWYGPWVGVLVSAFCFGISHFNIVQFLYAFIVGLGLGFIYVKSNRLTLPIIAHGLINLSVIIFSL